MTESNQPTPGKQTNDDQSLTPKELVKKHMEDPAHVVTDEELKKVKVGDDAVSETELENEAEEKSDEITNEDGRDDDVPNPYDVLGG
jgi:hypothetical protein